MDIDIYYEQIIRSLYEKLPMFSKQGKSAIRPGLQNTLKLCAQLGNPQERFKSIHIAGTNGKGSTSHMLAAILQKAGYKTGLYTSPHLLDFRERFRVNGKCISKEKVIAFVEEYQHLFDETEPSFFEMTVALAFKTFADEQVDIAVVETGLGGRLDSTNIIKPELSIITNISYDHTDLLGNTLGAIAGEKAGIIKQLVPVIIGEQHAETEQVFFEHAMRHKSPIYYADAQWEMVTQADTPPEAGYRFYKAVNKAHRAIYPLKTDLPGDYQQHNLKTALTATEVLAGMGYRLTIECAIKALENVKGTTGLRGRWEMLQESPLIICDVAHNPAGIAELMHQWKLIPAARKHIVTGFVKDKDVRDALTLFPKDAEYYFCNAQMPRALPAADLRAIAQELGLHGKDYPSVKSALHTAKAKMHPHDALLITGSFFIVAEAMA
jgi:dihydrofolate synthase / folylpolyglutamate synthase